jgi:RNA polymerase sigma-70 factor (ECF subfamily)
MNGNSIARPLSVVVPGDRVERLAFLFDTHYDRLYRLARRLSPTIDDALDLVQETFLKAARSVNSIPAGASSEEAWLVRVLINIRRDQWRKTSVREQHNKAEGRTSHIAAASPDSEASLIARTMVWQAVERLPPRRRAIVIMYELEGLSIHAIASLLGIRAVTVRWHLMMGRRDLNLALKAYMGGSNEKH